MVRVSAADEKHTQSIKELHFGGVAHAGSVFPEVPLAGQYPRQTAALHADAVQVFVGERGRERTTLGELYVSALSVARALTRLGLGPEDAIAVHMHHSGDALVAYIATCLVGGSMLVPIPGIYEERETAFILADSEARMLITEASWRGRDYVSAVSAYLGSGSLEYAVVARERPASPGYSRFDDLKHDLGDLPLPVTSRSISHKAAIIYTSGSTAVPKGAIHTDQAVVYELLQSCPRQPYGRAEVAARRGRRTYGRIFGRFQGSPAGSFWRVARQVGPGLGLEARPGVRTECGNARAFSFL